MNQMNLLVYNNNGFYFYHLLLLNYHNLYNNSTIKYNINEIYNKNNIDFPILIPKDEDLSKSSISEKKIR